MQCVYLNPMYSTAHLPFDVHGCIWIVMQYNVILIVSIKTVITFYLSFKAKFPVSYSLRVKPETS